MNETHGETSLAKWSKEVKRLDGYKCAYCGSTERLESHHIDPLWNDGPERILENGITLCHYHHRCAHNGYAPGHCGGSIVPLKQEDVEAVQAFVKRYQATRVIIEAPHSDLDAAREYAARHGETLSEFIKRAVMEQVERDIGTQCTQ